MVSVLARIMLFTSSYAPLLLLFALLKSFGPGWPSTLCLYVGIGSILALAFVWMLLRRSLSRDNATFEGSRNRDADVMAYVVSYVVPFAAAANTTDANSRWALALFAAMIALLYIRSAVFYVHPLLLLVGVHVYEGSRDGVPVVILTRQRYLRQQCHLRVVRISQNVYSEVFS